MAGRGVDNEQMLEVRVCCVRDEIRREIWDEWWGRAGRRPRHGGTNSIRWREERNKWDDKRVMIGWWLVRSEIERYEIKKMTEGTPSSGTRGWKWFSVTHILLGEWLLLVTNITLSRGIFLVFFFLNIHRCLKISECGVLNDVSEA